MGWAWDLKSASLSMVQKRAKRSGDGTYTNPFSHSVWGWGDKDMAQEDIRESVVLHEKKVKHKLWSGVFNKDWMTYKWNKLHYNK